MTHRDRVLLIEDDRTDALLVRRSLLGPPGFELMRPRTLRQEAERAIARCEVGGFDLHVARTLQQGLDRLAKGDVDVVLLDLHLPDSQGVETVVRLRQGDPDVPVVVLTGAQQDELACAALEAGAQDYLVKDDLLNASQLLRRTIRHAIERTKIAREQRGLQEQVARTQKMASLGVLSAGLALSFHEILGSILEEVDAVLEEIPGSATGIREHLSAIRRWTCQAGEITGQLRDYAAAERCHPRATDLSEFVLTAAEIVSPMLEGRAELRIQLAGRGPVVEAEGMPLLQILFSLLTNAAEAVRQEEGVVTVCTGTLEADRELLDRTYGTPDPVEGPYAFLRVSDDGHGMDPDTVPRIFDPFYTTRRAGRGLGLAAVLGLLRELRAVIHVESAPGEGSIFSVLLPLGGERARPPISAEG
jgi:C4-dicarboxylate-specific signal transduction histidine kinase